MSIKQSAKVAAVVCSIMFTSGIARAWEPSGAETPAAAVIKCNRLLRVINVTAADHLNLRTAPSADAEVLIGIPPAAHGVEDLGIGTGDWQKVTYKGVAGYVHNRFVIPDIVLCLLRQEAATKPKSWFEAEVRFSTSQSGADEAE